MLGQLTEVMSMDDVRVLYPKERITLYGINSNCELFLPIARSSFPSYFPFCFCSLLLQRRAVAALLSPGEVHGVVLCIALVFLSFLRFLLYSVDWTSVGHSLRCGSLGLETSTLNSFVDADRRFTDPSSVSKDKKSSNFWIWRLEAHIVKAHSPWLFTEAHPPLPHLGMAVLANLSPFLLGAPSNPCSVPTSAQQVLSRRAS